MLVQKKTMKNKNIHKVYPHHCCPLSRVLINFESFKDVGENLVIDPAFGIHGFVFDCMIQISWVPPPILETYAGTWSSTSCQ